MLNGVNAEALCELRAVNTLYLSETDHDALEHLIPAGNLFGHFNGQLSVVKCGIVTAELRFVCKTNPFAVDMKCGEARLNRSALLQTGAFPRQE